MDRDAHVAQVTSFFLSSPMQKRIEVCFAKGVQKTVSVCVSRRLYRELLGHGTHRSVQPLRTREIVPRSSRHVDHLFCSKARTVDRSRWLLSSPSRYTTFL